MGLERWADAGPFQAPEATEVRSFPASTKSWLSRLPEPWKRKLVRTSQLQGPHTMGNGGVCTACAWTVPCSSLPRKCDLCLFPSRIILGQQDCIRLTTAPGPSPPLESTWHVLLASPGLLGLCPARQFFVNQAGMHNLLGHTNDLITQLKCRPLSNYSLPYFL